MLRAALDLRGRRAIRHQLDPSPVGVAQKEASLALLVPDALGVEVGSGIGERAALTQLEARVVVPGLSALDELEAVRLVVAGEQRAAVISRPLGQTELERPAGSGLLEVGDAQANVVDAADVDHATLPSAT